MSRNSPKLSSPLAQDLRAALGPGFQNGGPSDFLLRSLGDRYITTPPVQR